LVSITTGFAIGSTDPYLLASRVLLSEKDSRAVKTVAVILMGLDLRVRKMNESGV
jgi:hypothetical protein